jgi:hypothetical protein
MSPTRILGAVALAALIAAPGAALARHHHKIHHAAVSAVAPSAESAAVNTSGVITETRQTAPDQLNTLVTNGPVPDTPENRAKYGSPMSNAGKRTQPAGN